jgi:hypothetical protein
MRHKNSISQINKERDKELKRLFSQAKDIAGFPVTIDRICDIMSVLPSQKFYISDYWALRYIKDRKLGKIKKFKNPNKKTLYCALYSTYTYLAKQIENQGKSTEELVFIALEQPAPIIGLSSSFIKNYLRYNLNVRQYTKE